MIFLHFVTKGVPFLVEWNDLTVRDNNGNAIGEDFGGSYFLTDTDLTDVSNALQSIGDAITDLGTGLGNEVTARSQYDDYLEEFINLINSRIDNLLYDPIPDNTTLDGTRIYLDQFLEVFSTDQVDGLEQRFALFSNLVSQKLSDVSAGAGTGLVIDKTNPAFPIITQNNPNWNNIGNKPADIINITSLLNQKESKGSKGIANGYASLGSNGKIPASQIPVFDPALTIVEDITERNALTPTVNLPCYVKDASLDATVTTGGAFYLYETSSSSWIKLSEMESMDIVQSWNNLLDKPATFPPEAHTHNPSEINEGFTSLLTPGATYEANLLNNRSFYFEIGANFSLTEINSSNGITYVFIFKITQTGISITLPGNFIFNDPTDLIDTTQLNNIAILTAFKIPGNLFLCSIKQEYGI